MNRTLLKAQLLYDEMGKSEKRIADFLLSHSGEVLPYTITELAEKCESSEATIVRFSRRLGFAGFQQLKIALAQQTERRIVSPNVTRGDTCYEIFEKVCNDVYLSFERTRRTLDASALEKASAAIAGAERVVLVGLGSSASVASDAANKFMRAGCNSVAYSDTHMQMIAVSHLSTRDVAIGISQSGASKDIVEALKMARVRGAVTIGITGRERSPVGRVSDILLVTDTEEIRHSVAGLNSHMSRLALIDALCCHIAYRNEARVLEDIDQNEQSLESKRIAEE